MLTFNFDFQNCHNLYPNFQKPPLPSKCLGYAPVAFKQKLWQNLIKKLISFVRNFICFYLIDVTFLHWYIAYSLIFKLKDSKDSKDSNCISHKKCICNQRKEVIRSHFLVASISITLHKI